MTSAPVSAHVSGAQLILEAPTGFNRVSLLGEVTIPLRHVGQVDRVDQPMEDVRGWRTGIGLPHLWMGTWRHDGVRDYVAVHAGLPGLVLHLVDEHFERIIISVTDPASLAAQIEEGRDLLSQHGE